MPQTIGRAWRLVRDRFADADMATPSLDARLLAERAFGFDGAQLAAHEHDVAGAQALDMLEGFAARRLAGEPVARILGQKEFFGLDFTLNAATLVPRPETELVVELGLDFLAGRPDAGILDLGTGTGCIAIALLDNLPTANGVAVDLSGEALEAVAINAKAHHVADRLTLCEGSWFQPVDRTARFDLIVSNPPYIESDVIAGLEREVRLHDPVLALDGGPDGLAPYHLIAAEARNYLAAGGAVIVELGAGQAAPVREIFEKAGYPMCTIHDDLAGIGRVVVARI